MGMSIMLPVALSLNGNLGVLMMLGIFCGAIYGGSITAIMINTPGTANSAATCLDGYPMAHKHHQPGGPCPSPPPPPPSADCFLR